MPSTDLHIDGQRGRIAVRRWSAAEPDRVVVISHGYGEHGGRYGHVAARLVETGAVVYAPDHHAHGRSEGERVRFDDFSVLVADFAALIDQVTGEHEGLPVILLGHSMGAIVVARYLQQSGSDDLAAVILSGPVIGGNPQLEGLLTMDPMPEIPIDPQVLSRDPAVGEAYAADELVYHGPFARETLQTMVDAIGEVKSGPGFGDVPLLWIHGELDALAPLEHAREVVERLRGEVNEEHVYPGAAHEILNEINRDEVLDDVVAFLDRVLADLSAAPAAERRRDG